MHIEKNVGTPLLMATTIAGGTLAYADPVRFENDGSFEWVDGIYLDITRGVSKQTGLDPGDGGFYYRRVPSPCCSPHKNIVVFGSTPSAEMEGYPAVSVRYPGAVVPGDFGSDWYNRNPLGYYYGGGAGFYTNFQTPFGVGYPGRPGYMAARFDLDGRTHYGWMSLTITRYRPALPTFVFSLLAWGYETEPNTPIEAGAVPAPSAALALLAFGAAAGATRARRE